MDNLPGRICHKCGARIEATCKFCIKCGAKLPEQQPVISQVIEKPQNDVKSPEQQPIVNQEAEKPYEYEQPYYEAKTKTYDSSSRKPQKGLIIFIIVIAAVGALALGGKWILDYRQQVASQSSATPQSEAQSAPTQAENQPAANPQPVEQVPVVESTIPTYISNWTASASSELPSDNGYNYFAALALDNNLSTAWTEGVNGSGIGEWVLLESSTNQEIMNIEIINGYSKSDTVYAYNNRIKTLEIIFSDGSSYTVELYDNSLDYQMISFSIPVITNSIKFRILDVYPGSKYDDTCIAEIRISK